MQVCSDAYNTIPKLSLDRHRSSWHTAHLEVCELCHDDGKGGALSRHVQTHNVTYDTYKRCFKGGDWVINESTLAKGGKFLLHTRVIKVPAE